MSVLSCKTRTGVLPRGIPRVYFCAAAEDFELYFEDISNEILSKQNCSVWYHGKTEVDYDDDFFEDLSQMHLFVVPIPKRFLQEGNPVLVNEFQFAVRSYIPILPLMQENGLENKFNEICGSFQFLDKYNADKTCIEYSDKLDKFLASILIGDDTVQKIRNAFDAYIFLSYRKKDRRYAQELMKTIHQNKFCRDIAIWYDEFLVPGEDFNSAINDAMKKSDLFVLAVTPNLINEKNYVMDVEYPMAKANHMAILPCEILQTDRDLLAQSYNEIPKCANGRDVLSMSVCLRQHFWDLAMKPLDSSPEHLFHIGLAYLNGIDVEVDRERALKLITMAAEQDYPDAIERLISMYASGDGVQTDAYEAIKWQRRLLKVRCEAYEKKPTYVNGYLWACACLALADAARELSFYSEAIEAATELKRICALVGEETCATEGDCFELKRRVAMADVLLGQVYHNCNDFDAAQKHYDMSLKAYDEMNEERDSEILLCDTYLLYTKLAQLCKVRAKYKKSLYYYQKALSVQKYCTEKYGDVDYLADQATTLCRISAIMRSLDDYESAKKASVSALEILDELIKRNGIKGLIGNKMEAVFSLAESFRAQCDMPGALKVFEQLAQLERNFARIHGTMPNYYTAERLQRVAQIYYALSDFESCIKYGEQALEIYKKENFFTDAYIASGGTEIAGLYISVAMSYYNARYDTVRTEKYVITTAELVEEYIERGILSGVGDYVIALSSCGELMQMMDKLEDGTKYLERANFLCQKYLPDADGIKATCTAYQLQTLLGKNYVLRDMPDKARGHLTKAEVLYQRLLRLIPKMETAFIRDHVQLTNLLAVTYAESDEPRAREYCKKAIAELELIPKESFSLRDWDVYGNLTYCLHTLTNRFTQIAKLRKKMIAIAQKMMRLYPDEYKLTNFYRMLGETEIFN